MSASMIVMVALVGVLLFISFALSYRLWKLRQVGGTAAILRDVPAVGGHGWRLGAGWRSSRDDPLGATNSTS
jgi:hypothetical protein